MKKALITISFTQLIDASMQGWFEKGVINSSYEEFLLKSQVYNQEKKFKTFQEMKANDGKANSLHYKCGFPVIPYVDLLKNEIPGLKDNTLQPIKFKTWQFQIIDSDINTKLAHKVSITYYTDVFSLLDNFGEYLLLAYGDKFTDASETPGKPLEDTFMLRLVPQLSFSSYWSLTN
ncbi:MAG TPA: hypothetical protein VE978_21625 [Chitinophagales bacterium]|nr:hypothetical protein [Chitinophagales bacterium]